MLKKFHGRSHSRNSRTVRNSRPEAVRLSRGWPNLSSLPFSRGCPCRFCAGPCYNIVSIQEELVMHENFRLGSGPPAHFLRLFPIQMPAKTTMTEKIAALRWRNPYGRHGQGAQNLRVMRRPTGWRSKSSAGSLSRLLSCSSTTMVFCINILDTPGHQDFSEDTYRTLVAADAAVMLIDGAKGVEAQTIKLFTVLPPTRDPDFHFHQ